jgi:putative endonuclease
VEQFAPPRSTVILGLVPRIESSTCRALTRRKGASTGTLDPRDRPEDDGVGIGVGGRLNERPATVHRRVHDDEPPFGPIYTGVTSNLPRRVWEHREGVVEGFTAKYRLKMLVWYEPHGEMAVAIQRETSLKRHYRAWKLKLIEDMNPEWRDLYPNLA